MKNLKASAQMKRLAAQLEEFSEKGVGSVLADELGEHVDAAREHLETVAAELSSAGL